MKLFFIFILSLFLPNFASALDAEVYIEGAVTVTAPEMFQLVESHPNMVMIDARRESDYEAGHIKGSIHMLTSTIDEERMKEMIPETSTPMLFYCQGPSCRRAEVGVRKALEYGYKHVYYYYGGIEDWRLHNYPVIQAK